ncbi:MAG: class I SAM-dependent methyltransferase [Burkholderiaceae bacterium]|jgi:hypothetical protein
MRAYVTRDKDKVAGWFSRIDAELVYSVACAQRQEKLAGSVVEIGLHHGKSFIALCLSLQGGEKAYGIDLFENQSLNIDASGKGERAILEAHLSRFNVNRQSVVIDDRSSMEIKPSDILTTVGAARLFSVDGGHWLDVVRSDLSLAENCLATHGVIALDDFLRPEWPDVSAGYFSWYEHRKKPIVPIAIGFNKLYLCFEEWAKLYAEVLERSPTLKQFLTKRYSFQGQDVPVYQTYLLPEFGYRRRLREYLKIYYPGLFLRLRGVRS